MRQRSVTAKAKDLGIDLNKESIGSLVDRLHTSQNNLEACQTRRPGRPKSKSSDSKNGDSKSK